MGAVMARVAILVKGACYASKRFMATLDAVDTCSSA